MSCESRWRKCISRHALVHMANSNEILLNDTDTHSPNEDREHVGHENDDTANRDMMNAHGDMNGNNEMHPLELQMRVSGQLHNTILPPNPMNPMHTHPQHLNMISSIPIQAIHDSYNHLHGHRQQPPINSHLQSMHHNPLAIMHPQLMSHEAMMRSEQQQQQQQLFAHQQHQQHQLLQRQMMGQQHQLMSQQPLPMMTQQQHHQLLNSQQQQQQQQHMMHQQHLLNHQQLLNSQLHHGLLLDQQNGLSNYHNNAVGGLQEDEISVLMNNIQGHG